MPGGNDQRREFHKRSDDVTEVNDRAEDQQADKNEMAAAAEKEKFMRVNGECARNVEETNRGNQKPNVQSLVAHHISIQKRSVVTAAVCLTPANHSHVVDEQTPDGYHMREKGCSAVQEVAFTLSNAIAYVQAAIDAGLEVDEFAPQIAFFFNGHNNVFQEVAKFRAVRRMWAEIMRDRFGATSPRSQMVRFHTQTGGSTLTAQQPENNIVRVALQGFAAVCGGTQSLHTNGFDEASGFRPSTPPGSLSARSR